MALNKKKSNNNIKNYDWNNRKIIEVETLTRSILKKLRNKYHEIEKAMAIREHQATEQPHKPYNMLNIFHL